MGKEILNQIINNFKPEEFRDFFHFKNDKFRASDETIQLDEDSKFKDGRILGEMSLEDCYRFIVASFLVKENLSEKSSKKSQYEIGKKVLKTEDADAGIFIFYDKTGRFRFSLIYTNYLGNKRRDFSDFRRFTYFVSPDPDQTNKTFLQQIGGGDFSSLEKIKEAFSVEPVTKQFFRELSNWYAWALKEIETPRSEKEREKKEIFLIRLITRLIFIWFMKEKELVRKYLFDKNELKNILKNLDDEESTYYKAILQNLFFATLSTKERRLAKDGRFFGKGKGGSEDFGNQYAYRYKELFKDQSEEYIVSSFKDIPFINGGLFECLDNKDEDRYFDGFTRRKKYQPKVPNKLFFSPEREVDLNKYYGTKNKIYKTEGLINILSRYNFTIDENTPLDVDIALDPELLGKVFENLLASYNPESAMTARKATGSYYTPREIVDYMVDESLKSYFKTKLNDIKEIDEKIEDLFSYSNTEHKFSEKEVEKIVKSIDEIRVLDPAVGSGAFPMGILQRLVYLLSKLDPKNKIWKEIQKEKILKMVDETFEKTKSKQERERRLKELNEIFSQNTSDYGRKLYLIKNCIYGVDIQPIAIQITKLRFFISLLVDMKPDEIQPLPNLDFKFVSANTLIPAPKIEQEGTLFQDNFFNELQSKIEKYFNLVDHEKKDKLREKIEKLIDKRIKEEKKKIENYIFEAKTLSGKKVRRVDKANKKRKEKLISLWESYKNIFSHNEPVGFFEPKYFFPNVKDGFDIVIANPPYVDSEVMSRTDPNFRNLYSSIFKSASGNWDLFVVFIEKGMQILKDGGAISYIVPNKLISARYTEALRKILLEKDVKEIRDFSKVDVFKNVAVYPVVFFVQNKNGKEPVTMTFMKSLEEIAEQNIIPAKTFYKDTDWARYFAPKEVLQLVLKISSFSPLGEYISKISGAATVSEAYIIKKYLKEKNNGLSGYKKFCNTGTIDRYLILWGKQKTQYIKSSFIKPILKITDLHKINPQRLKQADSEKIIVGGMSKELECAYDEGEFLAGKSTTIILADPQNKLPLKVIMALLNSKLLSFWYKHFFSSLTLAGGYLRISEREIRQIPIPRLSNSHKNMLAKLVKKILTITKDDDYLQNEAKQKKVKEYEKKIDQMVYKLYGLTPEEIKIVENYG